MKNKFLKGFLSITFLAISFASFAYPGGGDGSTTPEEEPVADIDSKLVILAVVGIAFAAYMLMQKRKQVKA